MPTDILTPRQTAFLKAVGRDKSLTQSFYLTGGTALAGFYLHYRYSEDLDFFSEQEVDPLMVDIFLKKVQAELGIAQIDFQQSYNRNLFFLSYGDETLKTEFTFFPFPRIEQGGDAFGVPVDSILDIAVNKLFTIYQQSRARDYIDLFCICREKGFTIADLVKRARIKFDWQIDLLQLGSQFVKAETAKDLPRMIQPLAESAWRDFFVTEAKKLKPEILQ